MFRFSARQGRIWVTEEKWKEAALHYCESMKMDPYKLTHLGLLQWVVVMDELRVHRARSDAVRHIMEVRGDG